MGSDHPDTLTGVSNLGLLLQAQGKLKEAEPYFRRAREWCERTLGHDHPHTLQAANSLEVLLKLKKK